ncbi:unnamed protein product, partial [Closterium sp. NIES-54]
MLPYLFPDLSSFTTVEDLVSHLRATDSRFRAALSAEFCAANSTKNVSSCHSHHPRSRSFTRYCLDSHSSSAHCSFISHFMDHFLALDPTILTVDDFEKHLLAADKNILAVGAARGTPRSPLPWGS